MNMFCFQCQETCKNTGCTIQGMCGKKADTANLQDELIFALKELAVAAEKKNYLRAGRFITEALFTTITNANFDDEKIEQLVKQASTLRCSFASDLERMSSELIGVLSTENEDVRSLRELLIYGIKGIAAYAHHAAVFGKDDESIYAFLIEALASTTKELTVKK